jgi:hypothetical protein
MKLNVVLVIVVMVLVVATVWVGPAPASARILNGHQPLPVTAADEGNLDCVGILCCIFGFNNNCVMAAP